MDQYGILAHPAKHSLSPVMHNAAFKELGVDAQYGVFDIPEHELSDFVEWVKHEPIQGLSVSLPHKQMIMHHLHRIDEDAEKIGAVNTVVNRGGHLYGYNTDYIGSVKALEEVLDDGLDGKQVVVIGAGGAARAVIYGVMKSGADVLVLNRSKEKAQQIAIEFAEMFETEIHVGDFGDNVGGDILIHTTSLWTKVDFEVNDLPYFAFPDFVENFDLVMDISYPPLVSPLVESCKEAGTQCITADRMLLHQAVEQFQIWIEKEAPVEIMREALERVII